MTGNHDIGYGSEVSMFGVQRFESAFGKVNNHFEISGHLFGIVNSMNLDKSRDKVRMEFKNELD